MDDRRFDALTRALAGGTSRRTAIKGLFGGAVGGIAVATRLGKVGAQPPPECETVLDCSLPDTCTTATCDFDESAQKSYCHFLYCDGYCCENGTEIGTCVAGGDCCSDVDCVAAADVCSKAICNNGTCEAVAGCNEGDVCCGQGTDSAHCSPECCGDGDCTASSCGTCGEDGYCHYPQCCDSGDCATYPCGVCNDLGICEYVECCSSYDCQGPCETCNSDGVCERCLLGTECCGDICVTTGTCCDGFGESCSHGGDDDDDVAAGDYQLSCCDGLLCCDAGKGTHACYECCGDWDCEKGSVCAYGVCAQCADDSQCGKGEICCYGECVYGECCSLLVPTDVASAGLEDLHTCGACEHCADNWCRSDCESWQVCCESSPDYFQCVSESEGCCGLSGDWCQELTAADDLNGRCCEGLNCCYDDKTKSGYCSECCGDWDCQSGYCCGGVCQAECCDDKDCEWGVCVDGYCKECRDDWGCGKGEICCEGSCEYRECCGLGDYDHCGDCGFCGENYQCYALAEFGEHCEVLQVADGSPEGNCCHGLVCCEWDKKSVCAECCGDWDCPKGCECDHGVCSCHCASDYDCAEGTCCCKSGACSADCCPPPPKPEPKPETPVTTLPATGSGDTAKSSGLFGMAALGAAAFLAAKKMRETPETSVEE